MKDILIKGKGGHWIHQKSLTLQPNNIKMMEFSHEEEFIKKVIPSGWRVFKARDGKSYQYYILNPQGKRFETFDDVHDFLVEERVLKEKGLRRKQKDVPTYLTTSVILRRHQMKIKNPFSNLLKRTLEKAHVTNDVLGETGNEKMERMLVHKELAKRKKKVMKTKQKKVMIEKAKEKRRHRGF